MVFYLLCVDLEVDEVGGSLTNDFGLFQEERGMYVMCPQTFV